MIDIDKLKQHMNDCAIKAPYEMNCFEIKEIYIALKQQQKEIEFQQGYIEGLKSTVNMHKRIAQDNLDGWNDCAKVLRLTQEVMK